MIALEVIESAGLANPKVSARAARLSKVGKAFWVFTAGVAIYNIATADNKLEAVAEEGVGIGGGMLGGAAGGAAAGMMCGPGAPICVTIGVFVGGALGAIGADSLFTWTKKKVQEQIDFINSIHIPYGPPGKRAFFCFPASTPVLCPDGLRPIESIQIGDMVMAFHPDQHRTMESRVVALDIHVGDVDLIPIETPDHELIYVTPGHWFFSGESWVLSEDLQRHNRVQAGSGEIISIRTKRPQRSWNCTLYNIRTEPGTYLVGTAGLVAAGVVTNEKLEESENDTPVRSEKVIGLI